MDMPQTEKPQVNSKAQDWGPRGCMNCQKPKANAPIPPASLPKFLDPNLYNAGQPQSRPVVKDTTNPKDAIGSSKIPLSLIPAAFQAEEALAYLEGKLKYGEVNWRATEVRSSVYLDAALRHVAKYVEGEDRDPISRVHHLANAAACFGIIVDAEIQGTLIDDRKMSNARAVEHMDSMIQYVMHLQKLFADKDPVHYKIRR